MVGLLAIIALSRAGYNHFNRVTSLENENSKLSEENMILNARIRTLRAAVSKEPGAVLSLKRGFDGDTLYEYLNASNEAIIETISTVGNNPKLSNNDIAVISRLVERREANIKLLKSLK